MVLVRVRSLSNVYVRTSLALDLVKDSFGSLFTCFVDRLLYNVRLKVRGVSVQLWW